MPRAHIYFLFKSRPAAGRRSKQLCLRTLWPRSSALPPNLGHHAGHRRPTQRQQARPPGQAQDACPKVAGHYPEGVWLCMLSRLCAQCRGMEPTSLFCPRVADVATPPWLLRRAPGGTQPRQQHRTPHRHLLGGDSRHDLRCMTSTTVVRCSPDQSFALSSQGASQGRSAGFALLASSVAPRKGALGNAPASQSRSRSARSGWVVYPAMGPRLFLRLAFSFAATFNRGPVR